MEIVFTVVFLIPIFFPFGAIYRFGCSGLEEEVEGGVVEKFGSLPVTGFWRGRAFRAFCPKGNETTTHNFLTPPTHIQTGTGCVERKWLFMTQIAQEWAYLVIRV